MRILLADSDQLFTRILKLKLEKWGHIVRIESSGDDAWKELQRQAYRVVILDFDLSGVDGPELCRRIRKLNRARYTYVLFYSSKTDHDSLTDAYKAGADDLLNKPFNPQLLQLRLKNGKRLLNLEDELRNVSSFDSTTGFINIDTFLRFFAVYEAGARRYGYSGLLTFITIDNFRDVYENYGYEIATQLKSTVAEVLPTSTRRSDLVSNLGTDSGEFCVLMPYTPKENAGSVISRVEERMKNIAVQTGTELVRAKISYSIAVYPQEERTVEEIMAAENREPFALNSAA